MAEVGHRCGGGRAQRRRPWLGFRSGSQWWTEPRKLGGGLPERTAGRARAGGGEMKRRYGTETVAAAVGSVA